MGGYGSGFQGHAKGTTSERHSLRIQDWAPLPTGASATWKLTLGGCRDLGTVHVLTRENALALTFIPPDGTPWEQIIHIARVPCTLGGSRPWFACPRCWRHCAKLYRGRHGYACRTCNRLNYPSTRETPDTRAVRRADKIRARLGWTPGIAFGHGPKPKGMHWRTFWRLVAEHDRHAHAFTLGSWERLGKAHARFGE